MKVGTWQFVNRKRLICFAHGDMHLPTLSDWKNKLDQGCRHVPTPLVKQKNQNPLDYVGRETSTSLIEKKIKIFWTMVVGMCLPFLLKEKN